MGKAALAALAALIVGFSGAAAADLFRVSITSNEEANALSSSGVDIILKVESGYLVLADASRLASLERAGLKIEPIAGDLDRSNLAIDIRPDNAVADRYPLVYSEPGLRLYQVDIGALQQRETVTGLAPLPPTSLPVVFKEPIVLAARDVATTVDYDSLIALIDQDSLESYAAVLQAFNGRVTGTESNYASRDWLIGKLTGFGYDSVYQDTFFAIPHPILTNCQNVIAVKPGTLYPDHYIIVCAHRDAVDLSPGADDNGSGTCAVLEIARVLRDIPTEKTFIFALFDAEEQGLYGSSHYASAAADRGDRIIAVMNMDMIAHWENTNEAHLNHGDDTTFAERWQTLADSLSGIGITGYLFGTSAGSDHFPFQQYGYDVVASSEWVFSTNYHSKTDSTTYLNFDYMARMARASLVTVYDIDATYQPAPELAIAAETELPRMMLLPHDTTLRVTITEGPGASMVPGSASLHWSRDGGPYSLAPMTDVGGGVFETTLPWADCGGRIRFYVSADEAAGRTYCLPDSSKPWTTMATTAFDTVFVDHFETNTGWTVSGNAREGHWVLAIPSCGGIGGDPLADYDGSGRCYVTGNTYDSPDVDFGTTSLTSPVFACTMGDAIVSYARWYFNAGGFSPYEDTFKVYISNNSGSTWTLVESVEWPGDCGGGWHEHSLKVSDYVAPSNSMKMRFDASDNGLGTQVEAGLDDFRVVSFACDRGEFTVTTDSLPSWTVGIPYSAALETGWALGPVAFTDRYGDLAGTGLSLLTEGTMAGTPTTVGPISFTVLGIDEAGYTTEKVFGFDINTVLAIPEQELPSARAGQSYGEYLVSTGGTGSPVWAVVGGGLDGTGLSLDSDGRLHGVPGEIGLVTFTARAVDAVGSGDERPLSVMVLEPFICGDVNGDGSDANIADLTYLVDHIFRDGAAPPIEAAADVNGSGDLNVADLTYLVSFIFAGGPAPTCP